MVLKYSHSSGNINFSCKIVLLLVSHTMDGAKKERGANFSPAEQELLISLITQHPIIECKKTDKESAAKKKQEWGKLANTFNSMSMENQRTVKNLQSLWKNMKRKAKTDFAAAKRERRGTGGGPCTYELNPMSIRIAGMHGESHAFDDPHAHTIVHFLF